jgi:TRAP-type C4-dicarboxylate transport system permease small subunit
MRNAITLFNRFNYRLSSWFEFVAILAFLAMMVGTLIDVVGAKGFHWPLPAGLEVVFFAQLIAIAGALSYSELDGRQIRVELFVDLFPKRVRAFFHALAALLGTGLFAILIWKSFQYAVSLKNVNDVTMTARIPLYPFALWLAICFIPVLLVLVGEFLKAIVEGFEK